MSIAEDFFLNRGNRDEGARLRLFFDGVRGQEADFGARLFCPLFSGILGSFDIFFLIKQMSTGRILIEILITRFRRGPFIMF